MHYFWNLNLKYLKCYSEMERWSKHRYKYRGLENNLQTKFSFCWRPKTKNLQYKIFHRIYFTNSKLFKCKLSETELCSFCNNTKETILHLFFECMYSKNILLSFVSLLQEKCNISYTITSKDIFFGPLIASLEDNIMFTCILIYKKYIDSCRLNKCLPSSDVFIQQIKRYKNLELYSLYLYPTSKANSIKAKWNIIKNVLE